MPFLGHKLEATVEASDLEVINLELELLKFYFSKVRIVPLRSLKLRLQVWVKWLKKEARWDRWELGRACHYYQPFMDFQDHRDLTSVWGTENYFHWVDQSNKTGFLENLQGSKFKTSFRLKKQTNSSCLWKLCLPLLTGTLAQCLGKERKLGNDPRGIL